MLSQVQNKITIEALQYKEKSKGGKDILAFFIR